MKGEQALQAVLDAPDIVTVLDIGAGVGLHAAALRDAGKQVMTVNLFGPADYVGAFPAIGPHFSRPFDCVWASHVLEHQRDPGAFLDACVKRLRNPEGDVLGGMLAVTVPPEKPDMVGGHLTTWTPGRLVYHLILAGLDCSEAVVTRYGYNISVVVRKKMVTLPTLAMDRGDLEVLAPYFPFPVAQNCSGWQTTDMARSRR